jgi:putative nucleotidyltransferase-like protein
MLQCFSPSTRPDLLALLRTIAKDRPLPRLSFFNDRQVRWIIETGLGPLLWFASQNSPKTDDSSPWRDIKAADLTTRLISEIQLETLSEILVRCKDLFPPVTLLKGSSIGSELYPKPHLRVMRDLDLLVDFKDQRKLERILLEMGFRQQSTNSQKFYATHHHSMPFYHRERGVWVEVHRGLFPPSNELAQLPVFSPGNIRAELRPSWLRGIPVMRLSTELQIVYTASHWALELKRAGGGFGLLDIVYLLKRSPRQIRWDAIFNWVQDSVAGTHLYLVLSYLHKNKIIDLDNKILADLFACQRSFGIINLKIAHSLITRYVVAGKIPISGWRLSAFWENLLLDHGAALNLMFATKSIMPSFGFRRATLS